MRDNDIRKIFDSAMEENTDTEINAEKIQDTIMERLGKRQGANISFYEAEDMENRVEPIYVTSPAKRSHKWAAAAVSAAAAACLAVTAVSTNFFGIGGNLTVMTDDITDTSELTDIPETETAGETDAETGSPECTETEKAEVTYDLEFIPTPPEVPYESWEDYAGNKLPLKNSSFAFLDGLGITIADDATTITDDETKRNWLLSEKDGRVYFWNGKEKKDVTELITVEAPYIESYVNEGSGLTHYLILGGDVAAGKYGYAEGFATHDSNRIWEFQMVYNCVERDDDKDNEDSENSRNSEVENILWYMINTAIRDVTGEEHTRIPCHVNGLDFSTVTLVCDR